MTWRKKFLRRIEARAKVEDHQFKRIFVGSLPEKMVEQLFGHALWKEVFEVSSMSMLNCECPICPSEEQQAEF